MLSHWIEVWLMNGYRNISIIPAGVASIPEFATVDGFYVYGDREGRECIGWIDGQEFWWNLGF